MPLRTVAELTTLAQAALAACGASGTMAATTARYLVETDLRGLATHGVARVPTYCMHLRAGRARGDAVPVIARDAGACCLVDAKDGLAFEACELAVHEAAARARRHGVAVAAVTNSHHFGAAGLWTELLAAEGLVGVAFSNAPAAIVPWGGARPIFGTNPVAAAFPRRHDKPLVVDLSLTQVTRGEIMLRQKAGQPIPQGWGKDKDGNPTTDAHAILAGGSLDAIGGMKGTMLALAVEILCCALTGAALSHEVAGMVLPEGGPMRLGQLFLAIDPQSLGGQESYLERVETLVAAMLADEGVRLPGARREALRVDRAVAGIEVPQALLDEMKTLAGPA
jgi:(2R)-3-sulfolactate dehydrogenase (NADP+)